MGATGALRANAVRWTIVVGLAGLMMLPAGTLLAPGSGGTDLGNPSVRGAAVQVAGGYAATAPSGGTAPGAGLPAGPVPSSLVDASRSPVDVPAPSWASFGAGRAAASTAAAEERSLPSAVAQALQGVRTGRLALSDVYLPSLDLLEHPVVDPASSVAPLYAVSPAPMGIADYGLASNSAYTVLTPDVLGAVNLSGYNATAGSAYEDTGNYFWNGLSPNSEATPWQSGLQLNTVVTNVSFPGSDTGVFWTQNVLDISGRTVQLVDNVWNFSAPDATLANGTLFSYNGTLVPDSYYYDTGPTLPLAFPLSIELFNNASTLSGRTTVRFGYRLTEGPNVFTGVYDTVVFNSRPSPSLPLLTPEYKVDGSAATPFGLLYDAELVFGGPGGGSGSVIASMNGSLALRYADGSGWSSPRSAYDYGADTGETSIGVAGTWTGTTEWESQGPSLLYGLWNATRAVPQGRAYFSADLAPSYGFVFIGPEGMAVENLSYAPSFPNGTLETWLPPSDPPALIYSLTAFADGFRQLNQTFSLLPPPNAPVHLALTPDRGLWDAPVYLDGNAQATSLALNATGSASSPLQFVDLQVDINLTFNHLNDFGFPEFDLFLAQGVSLPFVVRNVSQGPDNPHGFTWYVLDYPTKYFDAPGLDGEIVDWSGASDVFRDLALVGYYTPSGVDVGGVVSLWNSSGVVASDLVATNGSGGVWAADSTNLSVTNVTSEEVASGLYLADSSDAFASSLRSTSFADAVVDVGGTGGTFSNLTTSADGVAFLALASNHTVVHDVQSNGGLYAADVIESSNVSVSDVGATNGSWGARFVNSTGVQLSDAELTNSSTAMAVTLVHTSNSSVTRASATGDDAVAVGVAYANGTRVENTTATDRAVGVYLIGANSTTINGVTAADSSLTAPWIGLGLAAAAVLTYETDGTTIDNVTATLYPLAVWDLGSTDLSVEDLNASYGDWGLLLNGTRGGALTSVSCYEDVLGVELADGASGLNVTSSRFVGDSSYGVEIASGSSNAVYGNVFARDNGATSLYDPLRRQAYSAADNAFNSTAGVGNRWGDWHVYNGPHLAPYNLSNGVADDDPVGPSAEPVTFSETGLPGTAGWRVSIAGSLAVASPGTRSVVIWAPTGSDAYLVSGAHGYVVGTLAPTGTLSVSGPTSESVTFAPGATRTVRFTVAGEIRGTDWCAVLVYAECAATGTITFGNLTPGTYPYLVPGIPGYSLRVTTGGAPAPANGTLSTTGASPTVHVHLTPLRYGVTFAKLSAAPAVRLAVHVSVACTTSKSDPTGCAGAKASGVTGSSPTGNLTLELRNGTYTWRVKPIAGWELEVGGVVGWTGDLSVGGVAEGLVLVLVQLP